MQKEKIYDRRSDDLPINSVVAEVLVDDPLERGAKLKVSRSLRDDFLATLRVRGQITEAMLKAGRRWQEYYEISEIGGARAIDTTREAVDGGRLREPITDGQMKASDKIAEADAKLGIEGCALVRDMLVHRLTFAIVARRRELPERYGKEYLGRRFRECLATLAVLWGIVNNMQAAMKPD